MNMDWAQLITRRPGRFLSPARYRHPGDVIRLIASGLVLTGMLVAVAVAPGPLTGPRAAAVSWLGSDPAGRLLTGLVQVALVLAAAGTLTMALRHRRFRLLTGLVAGAAAAAALLVGLVRLTGEHAIATAPHSWLASAAFPGPALLAAAAAVTMALSPWLSRPWCRTAWITLAAISVARLLTGAVLPAELVLALGAGVTVGAGLLVAFGVPDRRMGAEGIAAALRSAGLTVASAGPAHVRTKGSRPFMAVTADGRRLFIKALGSDQRDADLLYRAYRFARLRDVGDTWPAASASRAIEHQALIGVMAERAGVRVPRVERVIKAGDGTALLVMEQVDGQSLSQLPAELISDDLLSQLWAEVDSLHRAGIAHRSLRAANVMIEDGERPWLTDFSFSELAATPRQMNLDLAELLASLATLVGADRATASASAVIGAQQVAAAAPLLQPLALSAATRHAAGRGGLLADTRAAAAASGGNTQPLARLQRVRPRTLLAIAAAAGAFYFVLPQLAQVGSSWHALQSAHWAWLPVIIAFSAVTYLASAAALIGAVPGRVPLWPATLTQAASSFVNRISPANIGGMALNARFLQKNGVSPSAGVAAVGVNALMGAVAHLILLVIFFALAGHRLAQAFRLPPASKLLLVLAVAAALAGLVLASRRGRRFAVTRLWPGVRSAAASLRAVAASPVKLTLLTGGSALITLAYIGGLVASVQAFGGRAGIAEIGAVYLGAAVIAAASPTPGGLGAIEAALVAGLTGVGVPPGPAVSAVLAYRLATYWLPVLPGWLCLRFLQHRQYI
jgi:glycosyltransferase 2 family protein